MGKKQNAMGKKKAAAKKKPAAAAKKKTTTPAMKKPPTPTKTPTGKKNPPPMKKTAEPMKKTTAKKPTQAGSTVRNLLASPDDDDAVDTGPAHDAQGLYVQGQNTDKGLSALVKIAQQRAAGERGGGLQMMERL